MRISTTQLWVHDQDEALSFYTEKAGFEVREDVTVPEMGNFRWVTVAPPGQEDVAIVLMAVPHGMVDEATATAILDLTAKGMAGTVFVTTDDVQRDYDAMRARGVEFTQEITDMPYGKDTAFRDPSGNNVRLAQRDPSMR
jgi:catechol 2,3-dioxygenase-like lactoylglutathione lyase family enzyme